MPPRVSAADHMRRLNERLVGSGAVATPPPPPEPVPEPPPAELPDGWFKATEEVAGGLREVVKVPIPPLELAETLFPELCVGEPRRQWSGSYIEEAMAICRQAKVDITPTRVDVTWPHGRHEYAVRDGDRWIRTDILGRAVEAHAITAALFIKAGNRIPVSAAEMSLRLFSHVNGPIIDPGAE